MNLRRIIDNLQLRGKFNLLLAIQILALILVGSMGWMTVAELQRGQGEITDQLNKTAALSRVLNDINVFRTVHTSMIGGAADPDYITAREGKLKEYADSLHKNLKALQVLPWSTENKVLLDEGLQAFEKYDKGFPALLAEARVDRNPKTIDRLMEANVGQMRTARERILKVQKAAEEAAQKTIQKDVNQSSAGKTWILGVSLGPSSSVPS
jgi:hypothetical protein